MNILGINAFHGDASAVLVKDGELVAAIEEERLNRRKHCAGFPALAVKAVLSGSGVAPSEVNHVVVNFDWVTTVSAFTTGSVAACCAACAFGCATGIVCDTAASIPPGSIPGGPFRALSHR